MRHIRIAALVLAGVLIPAAAAQQPPPSQQAPQPPDKAREIFDKMIEALGGDAFLNVHNFYREGRLFNFDSGRLSGPGTEFRNYVAFRDREWMEYGKKGEIVYLNNGDQGWELDKQGITEQTPEGVQGWQEGNRLDFEYLVRFRIREENLALFYVGTEFIDNRMAHTLEVMDSDGETLKLYVDARNYLPLQLHYSRHSEVRRGRVPFIEYYGKFVDIHGIRTPYHFTRIRDGQRVLEVFFNEIQFDVEIPEGFFTRENLEARWEKVK